jgi:hypothetical protein
MAGLVRKKVTVRGKSGKTFQRSVMVRAGETVKRTAGKVGKFVSKHKGKIAAAAAIGAGLLAARHGGQIAGAARGLAAGIKGHLQMRKDAKAAGMSVERGDLAHRVKSAVAEGRQSGRREDNRRMSELSRRSGAGALRSDVSNAMSAGRAERAGGGTRRSALSAAVGAFKERRATRRAAGKSE